jgi:asparagine synthase (glutamine-hydrolysing)
VLDSNLSREEPSVCGIFGYFSTQAGGEPVEVLDRCCSALRHRGPDTGGRFQDRGLYLGFRRLAVMDLSADGNQPMTSVDGRYTIVFNGEIYNFLELRTELDERQAALRGRSDTEVLLNLYARNGIQCLSRLNGMFAFGIYDRLERTLLLVRDRLGVKPLFYWTNGRTVAFSSEVRALRGLHGFPILVDRDALGFYLRLGVIPEWTSFFPGVRKLPPGCWVRFDLEAGTMNGPVAYWDLPPVGEEGGKSEKEWLDDIEALLWDATRLRLRSDAPLGVFLSGGIDSGLVAAAAAQQHRSLTSLTVGFPGEPEDETPLALASARHLGLNVITRNVDVREGVELLPRVMAHFDEPFSDTSALPTSLICAEARKLVTVVLSGDGGDEVFSGYNSHARAWSWRSVDRLPSSWRRAGGNLLASLSPRDSRARRFSRRLAQPVGRFGLGGKVYPFEDWLDGCLKPEFNVSPEGIVGGYDDHLPRWEGASSIDVAQRTDLRSYMLEDVLVKVDRMSMMHSLEVRSPFLDYRLVELGLRVPSHLRVKNGTTKYLLRRLAERHLPGEVCRAPKRGFGVPLRSWLNDEKHARTLRAALATNQDGFPDPFVEGGAERLWRLQEENAVLTSSALLLLCYRWWCQSRAAG